MKLPTHQMMPLPLLWAAAHRVALGCFWTSLTTPNATTYPTPPLWASACRASMGATSHSTIILPASHCCGGRWRCWYQWKSPTGGQHDKQQQIARVNKWQIAGMMHGGDDEWQGQWMAGSKNSKDEEWGGWRMAGTMKSRVMNGWGQWRWQWWQW